MNNDQINGILRIIIPAICTWLAAKGFSFFGDAGVVAQITALAIGAIAVIISYISHSNESKLKAAAKISKDIEIKIPEKLILQDVKIANLVNNNDIPNVTMIEKKSK